jgi:hypothetical protein
MALCPTPTCTATTHLLCLSRHFLKEEDTSLIPRGGVCVCCKSYVLWGEVIKGCYRRSEGIADMTNKRNEDVLGFTNELDLGSEAGAELLHVSPPKCGRSRKAMGGPAKPKQTKGTKRKSKLLAHPAVSDEGEFFDLNAISSDDEEDGVRPAPCTPHMPSRVPNITATATKKPLQLPIDNDREFFDLNDISSDDEPNGVPSPILQRSVVPIPASSKQPTRVPTTQRPYLMGITEEEGDEFVMPLIPGQRSRNPPTRCAPVSTRRKKQPILKIGEVDFFSLESRQMDENAVEGRLAKALSSLSVSSPRCQDEDVIELSD